jgi:hypothetical protein
MMARKWPSSAFSKWWRRNVIGVLKEDEEKF